MLHPEPYLFVSGFYSAQALVTKLFWKLLFSCFGINTEVFDIKSITHVSHLSLYQFCPTILQRYEVIPHFRVQIRQPLQNLIS